VRSRRAQPTLPEPCVRCGTEVVYRGVRSGDPAGFYEPVRSPHGRPTWLRHSTDRCAAHRAASGQGSCA